jgi:hypothetical protein
MDLNKELSPEVIRALNTNQVDIPPIGLEYLKMSEEEKANMSFNQADQKFMAQFMVQVADNIKGEQANSINAQNVLMFTKLEMISDGVNVFIKNREAIERVGKYEERLQRHEKTMKHLFYAVMALALIELLVIIFGPWYHNSFLTIFQKDKRITSEWNQDVSTMDERDKGIVRSVREVKMTDAQRDSAISADQEQILRMIKKY